MIIFVLFLSVLINADRFCGDTGDQEYLTLSNGVQLPRVGVGLAFLGNDVKFSVEKHLNLGFQLLDGAEHTANYDEKSVVEQLQKMPHIKRKDIFIVSKVQPSSMTYDLTYKSVEKMLDRWNRTSYLDLVYLHSPICDGCENPENSAFDSWKALEKHYEAGRIRSLGISNFNLLQFREFFEKVKIKPHVIQNFMDPFMQSRDVYEFAVNNKVAFVPYSQFGTTWERNIVQRNIVMESKVLNKIARANRVSVTSIVLAWLLKKKGIAVIPRSRREEHILENAKFLESGYANKILSDEQARRIDALDNVYNGDNDPWCESVAERNECGDDGWKGLCRASCWGLEY